MPTIRITEPTAINGQHLAVGDLIDVSDADARAVCGMGKATPADTAKPDAAPRAKASKSEKIKE